MAQRYPYFRFEVDDYMKGKIRRCSMEAQGVFTNLCCRVWQEEGELDITDIEGVAFDLHCSIDLLENAIEELKKRDCVHLETIGLRQVLTVNFLSEQLQRSKGLSATRSAAGAAGAAVTNRQKAESKKDEPQQKPPETAASAEPLQQTPIADPPNTPPSIKIKTKIKKDQDKEGEKTRPPADPKQVIPNMAGETPEFRAFWELVPEPMRTGRYGAAREFVLAIIGGVSAQQMQTAMAWQAVLYMKAEPKEQTFFGNPTRWITDGRFTDTEAAVRARLASRGRPPTERDSDLYPEEDD